MRLGTAIKYPKFSNGIAEMVEDEKYDCTTRCVKLLEWFKPVALVYRTIRLLNPINLTPMVTTITQATTMHGSSLGGLILEAPRPRAPRLPRSESLCFTVHLSLLLRFYWLSTRPTSGSSLWWCVPRFNIAPRSWLYADLAPVRWTLSGLRAIEVALSLYRHFNERASEQTSNRAFERTIKR